MLQCEICCDYKYSHALTELFNILKISSLVKYILSSFFKSMSFRKVSVKSSDNIQNLLLMNPNGSLLLSSHCPLNFKIYSF